MRYDYQCNDCDEIHEEERVVDDRKKHAVCKVCGGKSEFIFPLGGFHYWPDIPEYHDECLDVDITGGRKEKKAVLKSMGLIESGDKVGGARNFDSDGNTIGANHKPIGRSFDDVRREQDAARDSFVVDTVNESGAGFERKTATNLESATAAKKVHLKAKPL